MFDRKVPRTAKVQVRLTDVERGYLSQAAAGRSISDTIRDILNRHFKRTVKKGR